MLECPTPLALLCALIFSSWHKQVSLSRYMYTYPCTYEISTSLLSKIKQDYFSFLWTIKIWLQLSFHLLQAVIHISYQNSAPYFWILITFLLTRCSCYAYIILVNWKSLILIGLKLYENLIKTISSLYFKWAAPSEFGTYRLCEQRRFRRACASAQSSQNLRCSLIQAVSQEEPSDRKPDPWPLWMAGHAQLKFVMTECSKTQIRLTGLI